MKIHIVKEGDTLYELSKKYQVDLTKLVELNPHIGDPDELDVGTKIRIPTSPAQIGYTKDTELSKKMDKAGDLKEGLKPLWSGKLPASNAKKIIEPIKSMAGSKLDKEESVLDDAADKLKGKAKETVKGTVEDTVKPIKSKTDDLFDQYKTPATKVGSFYDMPDLPDKDMKDMKDMKDVKDMKDSPWGMPYKSEDYEQNIPGLETHAQPGYLPLQGGLAYPNQMIESDYAPMPNSPNYNYMPYSHASSGMMPNYVQCGPQPSMIQQDYMPYENTPYSMPCYPTPCGSPSYNLPYNTVPYGMPTPYMPQFPNAMAYGQASAHDCKCQEKKDELDFVPFDDKEFVSKQAVSGKAKVRTKASSKKNINKSSHKARKRIVKHKDSLPWLNK